MPKTLQISATNARKDFFNLIDLVSQEDVQVHISKKGLSHDVLLTRDTFEYHETEKSDIRRVRDTAGALKTSGYIEDEVEIAQSKLAKEYLKKNPRGTHE